MQNNGTGKTNGFCIAGFVVSLVTMFILSLWGISGIVGIILSAVGRSRATQSGGATGLGTAGLVLGIINVLLTWLMLALSCMSCGVL